MDILAIASFAGAHYLRVFAKKKLGFVRWLNFNGAKLSESIPFDTLKFVMLILILPVLWLGTVFLAVRNFILPPADSASEK